MIPAPYFQILQTVVIKDTVIDTLTCGTFAVYLLIFLRIPWDAGMETEICVVLYVDSAPIRAGGTFFCMWAGTDTAAFERAAVLVCVLNGIVAPRAHFVPGRAYGMPGFIKSNVIWCIFRRLCPPVDINEGIDIPAFQQFISGDVVMGGVKAYVFGGNAKGIAPEIINGIEEIFAVMAACVGEFHQQREFNF